MVYSSPQLKLKIRTTGARTLYGSAWQRPMSDLERELRRLDFWSHRRSGESFIVDSYGRTLLNSALEVKRAGNRR
jgi:hypothetical protein